MQRFGPMKSLQKFASVHGALHNRFRRERFFPIASYLNSSRSSEILPAPIAISGRSRPTHDRCVGHASG